MLPQFVIENNLLTLSYSSWQVAKIQILMFVP
jgi:hypothetical protein